MAQFRHFSPFFIAKIIIILAISQRKNYPAAAAQFWTLLGELQRSSLPVAGFRGGREGKEK